MDVRIRPLEEEDANVSYVWRNDPEIWRYTGSAPNRLITLEDERAWIRNVIEDDTCKRFAITVGNQYVGNIYLTGIRHGEAEYHIFIGNKEYMGKGIAKKASKLLINYAREKLNLKSINLEVKIRNTRAVQLYLSLGFKVEKEDAGILVMRMGL